MARITLGIGTSHSPLLTFGAELWKEYSTRDLKNQRLNTIDGRYIPYGELLDKVGGKYAAVATQEQFVAKEAECQRALDRIAAAIAQEAPDVIVIVTDDENELFSRANTPAVSIYYGDTIVTRPFSTKMLDLDNPPVYFTKMVQSYAMETSHTFPAMPEFARGLIERLIEKHIDVGAAAQVEEPNKSGFGHGVGFVEHRLFGGKSIPVIPVLINTYYPPNAPMPARCYDIGRALREAIEESPGNLRVAVLASGGLSHFVVEEELDRKVLDAISAGKPEVLRTIPMRALISGSSEIRNWIVLAGAIEGKTADWVTYQPLYRTPAGTGIGAGFGVWR